MNDHSLNTQVQQKCQNKHSLFIYNFLPKLCAEKKFGNTSIPEKKYGITGLFLQISITGDQLR